MHGRPPAFRPTRIPNMFASTDRPRHGIEVMRAQGIAHALAIPAILQFEDQIERGTLSLLVRNVCFKVNYRGSRTTDIRREADIPVRRLKRPLFQSAFLKGAAPIRLTLPVAKEVKGERCSLSVAEWPHRLGQSTRRECPVALPIPPPRMQTQRWIGVLPVSR